MFAMIARPCKGLSSQFCASPAPLTPKKPPIACIQGPKALGREKYGQVAEWFKATVLKTVVGGSSPWVRIPPCPPIGHFPTFLNVPKRLINSAFSCLSCFSLPLAIPVQRAYGVGINVGTQTMGILTATGIKAITKAGRYGDGDGLFLVVKHSGARSWVCRVQKDGRRRDYGLGSASKVTLKQAREKAVLTRSQVEAGIDPVKDRKRAAGIPTFREAMALHFAEQKAAWRNAKHSKQWTTTLETYALPHIGDMTVATIDGPAIREVLMPIWLSKQETARRVRQRVLSVLQWAEAKGYRDAPPSMAAINKSLPKATGRKKHHPALPYADLPEFLAHLRERESMGRLVLEMAILTAARSGEVRGMAWGELDLEAKLWTVPAERMKAKREHIVPLCAPALAILERVAAFRQVGSDLVFNGQTRGAPLSDMTLSKAAKDLHAEALARGDKGYLDRVTKKIATPHGFRSTFRDWTADKTTYPNEVCEMALAHSISSGTEKAYRRDTMVERRAPLMELWGGYCSDALGGNVVRIAG